MLFADSKDVLGNIAAARVAQPVQLLDLSSRIVDVHGIVLEVPVDRCDSSTNILEP